jgi:hypothetical protein
MAAACIGFGLVLLAVALRFAINRFILPGRKHHGCSHH